MLDLINKISIKKVHSIFPIPIGEYNFDSKIDSKLISLIEKIPRTKNISNYSSVSNYVFNEIKEFEHIENFCKRCLNDFFQEIYKPLNKTEIYITQSWLNYTNAGEWHQPHTHSNSILSGVFYIQSCEEDKIYFLKEKGYDRLNIVPREHNIFNTDSIWLKAKEGRLYLFDSSTNHCVETRKSNLNEKTRISLSFNTFIRGKIGSQTQATELTLE